MMSAIDHGADRPVPLTPSEVSASKNLERIFYIVTRIAAIVVTDFVKFVFRACTLTHMHTVMQTSFVKGGQITTVPPFCTCCSCFP